MEEAPDDGEERSVEPGPEDDLPEVCAAKAIGNLGRLGMAQTVGGFSKIITFNSMDLRMIIARGGDDESSTSNTFTCEL